MKKYNQKESIILQRKSFTPEEINKVCQEVHGDFSMESRDQWLKSKNAISFLFSKSITGESIRETRVIMKADGSIPYTDLSLLWDFAKYVINKRPFAENEQLSYYDQLAQQMPDKTINTDTLQESMI